MRLVQISDCHLHADPVARGRGGDPLLPRLRAVVEAANRERPDRVLVSGDLSDDGSAAAYAWAVEALDALDAPWCWLAGNHDAPAAMPAGRERPEAVDLDGWCLRLLDTRVPGRPHGALGAAGLVRLAEALAADARPTLLAMHHPPMAVGSAWLDAIGLADREAFWATLGPYPQVRAILCGHVHQAFDGYRRLGEREVAVHACPATADAFLPGATDFAFDAAAPPGYRVVDLAGETLRTRVAWVEM